MPAIKWWCSFLVGAILMAIAGCSAPNKPQREPDVETLSSQVRSLQSQLQALQQENQTYKQQVEAFQTQVQQQQQDAKERREEYQKALSSPGYEAAFRLVYARLQAGDTTLLRDMVAPEREIEAGTMLNGTSTYRTYQSAADVNLQPYADWAINHPGDQANIEVFARMPGYAWVHAHFPDGTRFSLFFEGASVIKILSSDQPFDLT